MTLPEVELTIRGPVKEKTQLKNNGFTFTEKRIKYTTTIDNIDMFRKIIAKSPSSIAEYILPEEYYINKNEWSDWEASTTVNAVEASKVAEHIAEETENLDEISTLTLWLQNFGGMRVRRALHTKLRENGVDVNEVD